MVLLVGSVGLLQPPLYKHIWSLSAVRSGREPCRLRQSLSSVWMPGRLRVFYYLIVYVKGDLWSAQYLHCSKLISVLRRERERERERENDRKFTREKCIIEMGTTFGDLLVWHYIKHAIVNGEYIWYLDSPIYDFLGTTFLGYSILGMLLEWRGVNLVCMTSLQWGDTTVLTLILLVHFPCGPECSLTYRVHKYN